MPYNYFPTGYSPMMPYNAQIQPQDAFSQPQQMNPQGAQNRAQGGFLWVQGEAGAKGYPVAPNTTVQLWDSEQQVIYLKSADASGMPTMKILDYTIREATHPAVGVPRETPDYITREEFEKRMSELKKEAHHESDL